MKGKLGEVDVPVRDIADKYDAMICLRTIADWLETDRALYFGEGYFGKTEEVIDNRPVFELRILVRADTTPRERKAIELAAAQTGQIIEDA